jgi:hypothetical protein
LALGASSEEDRVAMMRAIMEQVKEAEWHNAEIREVQKEIADKVESICRRVEAELGNEEDDYRI